MASKRELIDARQGKRHARCDEKDRFSEPVGVRCSLAIDERGHAKTEPTLGRGDRKTY